MCANLHIAPKKPTSHVSAEGTLFFEPQKSDSYFIWGCQEMSQKSPPPIPDKSPQSFPATKTKNKTQDPILGGLQNVAILVLLSYMHFMNMQGCNIHQRIFIVKNLQKNGSPVRNEVVLAPQSR